MKEKHLKFNLTTSFLVFTLAFLALLPTLTSVYIWDDIKFVSENKMLENAEGTLSYFTTDIYTETNRFPLYRPILFLSLFLNRLLLGHNAFSYHLINLILHCIASLLLYHVIVAFWGYTYRSLIPALIFAVHPIHVDSVSFIMNRSDILALIFLLLSLIVLLKNNEWKQYLTFDKNISKKDPPKYSSSISTLSLAALFFLFAHFAKVSSVPALLVLLLLVTIKSLRNKRMPPFQPVWLGIIVFFLILLSYLVIRFLATEAIGVEDRLTFFKTRSFTLMFPTMSRVFANYIFLLVAPFSLKIDYSNYAVSQSILDPPAVFSYILHSSILIAALLRIKKNPMLAFCIFSFYIFLLPVSNLVPFFSAKAERFLYIPSIFYCLILSLAFTYFEFSRKYTRIIVIIFSILIIVYGSISFRYATLFKSPMSLWSAIASKDETNATVQYNYGYLLYEKRQWKKAIPYLIRTLQLKKDHARTHIVLGEIYFWMHENDKAEKHYNLAFKLIPGNLKLNNNYAVFKYYTGDLEKAYKHIKISEKLDPLSPDTIKIKRFITDAMKKNNLKVPETTRHLEK